MPDIANDLYTLAMSEKAQPPDGRSQKTYHRKR